MKHLVLIIFLILCSCERQRDFEITIKRSVEYYIQLSDGMRKPNTSIENEYTIEKEILFDVSSSELYDYINAKNIRQTEVSGIYIKEIIQKATFKEL
jgi:hypothetical protein